MSRHKRSVILADEVRLEEAELRVREVVLDLRDRGLKRPASFDEAARALGITAACARMLFDRTRQHVTLEEYSSIRRHSIAHVETQLAYYERCIRVLRRRQPRSEPSQNGVDLDAFALGMPAAVSRGGA